MALSRAAVAKQPCVAAVVRGGWQRRALCLGLCLKTTLFDALPTDQLSALDPAKHCHPRQVDGCTAVLPTPPPFAHDQQPHDNEPTPRVVAVSPSALALLGVSPHHAHSPEFAHVLGGKATAANTQHSFYAHNYGGHQFGVWAGQLGDGRALSLGNTHVRTTHEAYHSTHAPVHTLHEVQLKGTGRTPFSRHADGQAVLRSSLREFVCAEALHSLGVPTSRTAALMLTGRQVPRDMFYDGCVRWEPGAVVCRVAPSFLRFGTFQLFASRGDEATVRALLDYLATHHFGCVEGCAEGKAEGLAKVAHRVQCHENVLSTMCASTAAMVARWQTVGLVHGVMNTDNMSAHGLTLDFGPFAFMGDFNPRYTPNASDAEGRYAYVRQPEVGLWNCGMLASALVPVLGEEDCQSAVDGYADTFLAEYWRGMGAKFGLPCLHHQQDHDLVHGFHALLAKHAVDFTGAYRRLCNVHRVPASVWGQADQSGEGVTTEQLQTAREAFDLPGDCNAHEWVLWIRRYVARCNAPTTTSLTAEQRIELMLQSNPRVVPRQHLLHEAITALEQDNDSSPLHSLCDALRTPYAFAGGAGRFGFEKTDHYSERAPEWANELGVAVLS